MKVEFTPQADRHVHVIDTWWQENREQARDLFMEELALAVESLVSVPLTGRLCPIPGVRGVRRILLRNSRYHLYYRVARDVVTVVAVWSAVRERGPAIADLRGIASKRRKRH